MTLGRMLRPVLVCLAALGAGLATSSCGMVDSDPHRFENMAESVADISLDSETAHAIPVSHTAAESGLRPVVSGPIRVEVMDPHDLWDARDAAAMGLRGAVAHVIPVADTATETVKSARVERAVTTVREPPAMRPVITREAPSVSAGPRTTIQLGAYGSEAAAQAAWSRVNSGPARQALKGLAPIFEATQVQGRAYTRLKVAAPASAAMTICHAAQITDPWCARHG